MSVKTTILDFLGRRLSPQDYRIVGVSLSDQQAVLNLAIQIAVGYIAGTLSQCEIKTYEAGKEVHGELYYRLNVSPNPNQNSSQLITKLVETMYYEGEALMVKEGPHLYVADGFSTDERPRRENVFTSVSIEKESVSRDYKASDAFLFSMSDRNVRQLVQLMFGDYGKVLAAAMDKFVSSNSDKFKLKIENIAAGDKDFQKTFEEQVSAQLKSFMESSKAVYPEFRGYNLERLDSGTSSTSSDVISMRKEVFETVAQAFKIPMSMMYGNITNMAEIVKVYLSICIDPLAQMISDELTRKTTDYESWLRGDKVVVDTSRILHVDILEVADEVEKLIGSGAFTINDVLKRCGYDTISDEFADAHYLTKNIASVDEAASPLEGGEQNGSNQDTNEGDNSTEVDAVVQPRRR